MTDVRVEIYEDQVAALLTDPEAQRLLMEVGQDIAASAAGAAPQRTGAGAASIHPEWVPPEVQVSWDAGHAYMHFQESGTRYVTARPFLGPALDHAHL